MKTVSRLGILFMSLLLATKAVYAQESSDTYLSEEIQNSCYKYGEEYGICPELIMAIIEHESMGLPTAENGSCKGLMQVSEKWHKNRMEALGVDDLFDIDGNIHVGVDYLAEIFEQYPDVYDALMCYNMGISGAKKNIKTHRYTRYAISISDRSIELEELHERIDYEESRE